MGCRATDAMKESCPRVVDKSFSCDQCPAGIKEYCESMPDRCSGDCINCPHFYKDHSEAKTRDPEEIIAQLESRKKILKEIQTPEVGEIVIGQIHALEWALGVI